ncbi:Fibulin-1 [Acipenser ruthenus]|uniref:Fibulin-1 n=1 Tax=Acipenser ruthenus TaxID=7906 RepID=A0A444UIL1_ACIRT|nr:Fibulin-1 [Acipenser ruthenus]
MSPPLLASLQLVLLLLLMVLHQSGCGPSPPVPSTDCAAVQCPPLETACIEEGAPSGDRATLQHSSPDTARCCPVCLKKGCRCRGYQLWDCVSAGYTGGTVPAGGSYLVDSGSTECICPAKDGGEIECNFLPCPELPPNCLEVWDPLEEPRSAPAGGAGCPRCKKTGCVSDGRELEEGESFAVPPCTVCSCLGSGALLCTPERDCEGGEGHARAAKGSRGPQPAHSGAPAQPEKELKHLTQLPQKGAPRRLSGPQGATQTEIQDRASQAGAPIVGAPRSEAEKGVPSTQLRATSRVSWPLRTDQGATQTDRQQRVEATDSRGQNVRLGFTHTGNGIMQPGATNRVIWPLRVDQGATQTEQENGNRIGDSGAPNRGATELHVAVEKRKGHFRNGTGATEQSSGNRVVSVTVGATVKVRHKESQSGAATSGRKEAGSGASQGSRAGATHRRRRPQIMGIVGRIGVTSKPKEKPGATRVSGANVILSYIRATTTATTRGRSGHLRTTPNQGPPRATGPKQRLFPAAPGLTQAPRTEGPQTSGQGATLRRGSKEGPQTGNQTVMSQSSLDPCCAEGRRLAAENRQCTEAPPIDEETGTCRVTRMYCCLSATEEGACQVGVAAARQGGGVCQGQSMGGCIDDTARFCTDTGQSLLCSCFPGYRLNSDLKNCEDVNECESSPCSQECANVFGSYHCYCQKGFVLNQQDKTTCEDIDECSLQGSPSLCSYRCVNSPGSFHCACPDLGYELASNGRNCRDQDECALGTHNCSSPESCFNIEGGFRCLSVQCPLGYLRTGEHVCERESCSHSSFSSQLQCQSLPQRVSFHQLSFPSSLRTPAPIFRIAPSPPVFSGDRVEMRIVGGNEEGLFSARSSDRYSGLVSVLAPPPSTPRDFLLLVEMTLLRHGAPIRFQAQLRVFVTPPPL